MPSQRHWCFTSFTFPDFELHADRNFTLRYVIFGKEICPDTGRLHFQGYCEFSDKVSMKNVKQVFNDTTMHLEPRYGSQEQAIKYCQKDGDYLEWGSPQYSGKRNDLKDVIDECKTVGQVMDQYPQIYCAYRNGLRDIYNAKFMKDLPEFVPIEVFAYIGPTGTGKTRKAIEENAGKYYKLTNSGSTLWFDGYSGQEVLIIDEFYGWIKWNFLLQMLDGYKLQVPIKGGFACKNWNKVIITSNREVSQWYPRIKDISPLNRRIKEIVRFGDCVESNVNCNDFIFTDEVPADFSVVVDNNCNDDH